MTRGRRRRVPRRSRIAVCAVLAAGLLSAACGVPDAPSSAPAATDAGVSIPGDFTGSGPGTLLSATTLPLVDRRLKAVSALIARISYVSTSGITDEPTEVTGSVFVPAGRPPQGGWPVIAFGHPTTGVMAGCAPSLSPTLLNLADTVLQLVKAGYVVAMTDFQGLGDDQTYHPYLDATTAAYNLIDSVRATRKLTSDAAERWLGFGTSQGAQATWAANELAGEYGQGLELVGSVSVSPPLDVSGYVDAAADGTLSREQQPVYQALLASYAKEFPAVDLDQYRRGIVEDEWNLLLQCDFATSEQRSEVLDHVTADDLRPANPEAADALRTHLGSSTLPRVPTTAPALVIYGGLDTLIPPAWTDAALRRACELGDVVDIGLQPDKGHADVDVSSTFPWIADRFSGVPAPNGCASLPEFDAPEGSALVEPAPAEDE